MSPAPNEQSLVTYVRQAFDQLELQLSKEKLEQLQVCNTCNQPIFRLRKIGAVVRDIQR